VWEFGALVTSLNAEVLTLGQLYRDRADGENNFDELKNQWGWGGFDPLRGSNTQDLKRCRLIARFMALVFNWWTLSARLADPDHHREAITTRPSLLTSIGRQTTHAGPHHDPCQQHPRQTSMGARRFDADRSVP
jgi:hypothetical protein